MAESWRNLAQAVNLLRKRPGFLPGSNILKPFDRHGRLTVSSASHAIDSMDWGDPTAKSLESVESLEFLSAASSTS